MAEFVRSPRSRHLSSTKAEEITRAIVNMVVQDYMPPRIVDFIIALSVLQMNCTF